ncbi:MAG: hypothetical protein ACOC3E_02980 [Cyanobacteriota bacterium]
MFSDPNTAYESEEQREARRVQEQRERDRQQRQQRQQAAKEAQMRQERNRIQDTVYRYRDRISKNAQKGLAAEERGKIKTERLQRLEREAPSFANAGPLATMGYTLFILGAIAVVLLNFFLINAPVKYLTGTAFKEEYAWQAQAATVLVPVFLLIFELCISLGRRHARREDPETVWKWQVAGGVMIAFTPLMIIGTMLARTDWFLAYNLVTSTAMIVIAAVTDALIIFGGEQIYQAQAFVWFHASRWRIERDIHYFSAKRRAAGYQVERAYARYSQILNHYNDTHPEHPLPAGPFSRDTARFVNKWLQQEAIAMPPEEAETQENDENDPPAAAVPNRPSTPPNGGTDAAEADYYRNLVANQVRRNEREVQPD